MNYKYQMTKTESSKTTKKTRKGGNAHSRSCANYKQLGKRMLNKIRKMKKHLKKHVNDKFNLERLKVITDNLYMR